MLKNSKSVITSEDSREFGYTSAGREAAMSEKAISALNTSLIKSIKKGDVYVNHISTSRSGMSRAFSFYVLSKDGLICINREIGSVLGLDSAKNGRGLNVVGCGMDMVFATLYSFFKNIGLKNYPHLANNYKLI
ncbi:MAG: hypothetical protein LBE36_06715 [Flavobacteriaceae bacterium]|jgi:hypothetical protein|nr:hypothetical protein [Flavobacteriaceae bacterium]